ncbi:hypothetical protein [Sphingomonas sp.]|uniref:hypothetical protein n=1 Tax=Sphingomonas sp. TaxID=28214 RepID=UPI003CC65722
MTGVAGLAVPGLAQPGSDQNAAAASPGEPPQVAGFADFAGAWSPNTEDSVTLFAAEPDIATGIAELFGSIRFARYAEIESYFQRKTQASYIDWFNRTLAGRGDWRGRRIGGEAASSNFELFWTQYLQQQPVTLLEFIAYMSIFTNECGGNLISKTEVFGNFPGHPGISYLFDRIRITRNGRIWSKRSYNGGGNRTAKSLFNDAKFNQAHGGRVLAERLRGSTDAVWAGVNYPQSLFPVSGQDTVSGYLLETDFFKFRGRGLIQTTWRENYSKLVRYIQAYNGTSSVVREYRERWSHMAADDVCTISSNADWDRLFADTERVILCHAVKRHADDGGYFPLARSSVGINASADHRGSIGCMGLRIGGGRDYAATFKGRVRTTCEALALAGVGWTKFS